MFDRIQQPPSRAAEGWRAEPGAADTAAGRLRSVAPPAAADGRLTARGAALGMFVVCLLGVLGAGWLRWGPLAGGAFVLAAVAAAARTQPRDLLIVVVIPPALFAVAVICAKALTSHGSLLLSTAEGTLITLAGTAPWLLAGTALSLVVTLTRGLRANVRALGEELHADPFRGRGGPDSAVARRRPA